MRVSMNETETPPKGTENPPEEKQPQATRSGADFPVGAGPRSNGSITNVDTFAKWFTDLFTNNPK